MERRDFLKISIGAGTLALMQLAGVGCKQDGPTGPIISLPPLPYPREALEPYISANTVDIHYGKHHAGYVGKLKALVKGTPYQGRRLGDIILDTAGDPAKEDLFHNAAQVFNHTFYWNSMKTLGGGRPTGRLGSLLEKTFGSYSGFCDKFTAAATSHFGSGWAWLVRNEKGLEIVTTTNADTPITKGIVPLITLDVWEHAYYLDYQNQRSEYVKAFLAHLINWDFAEMNLG